MIKSPGESSFDAGIPISHRTLGVTGIKVELLSHNNFFFSFIDNAECQMKLSHCCVIGSPFSSNFIFFYDY